jgi:hypothetical protein
MWRAANQSSLKLVNDSHDDSWVLGCTDVCRQGRADLLLSMAEAIARPQLAAAYKQAVFTDVLAH